MTPTKKRLVIIGVGVILIFAWAGREQARFFRENPMTNVVIETMESQYNSNLNRLLNSR